RVAARGGAGCVCRGGAGRCAGAAAALQHRRVDAARSHHLTGSAGDSGTSADSGAVRLQNRTGTVGSAHRQGPPVSCSDSRRLRFGGMAVLIALGACKKGTDPALTIETATVERRSIVLSVQANGTVELVNIVEVKSK